MPNAVSLAGTPAQISMAASIRAVWIERITHSLADAYPTDPNRTTKALDVMIRLVYSIPDAHWWIENLEIA